MKRVKFWSRTASGSLVLREDNDPSAVSLLAWKTFNKKFFRWYRGDCWYPLDPMAAYQRGVLAMITASEKPGLRDPDAYVIKAGLTQLKDFGKHHVGPARATYRTLAGMARVVSDVEGESRGEDKSDREWSPLGASSLNVQAYVESMACQNGHAVAASRREAQECLLDALPKLDPEASRGFHCYLAAGGKWRRAAALMGLSCSTYRRRFKRWSAQFKGVCEWI